MSPRVTKDKAFSFDPSTLLTVVVGVDPDQKQFSIHEGIICARSEFFRRAMSGNWLEKEERLIKLPEDDPDIFALYVNLVYTNCVPSNWTADPKTPTQIRDELDEVCTLYILCEKLRDSAAKNAAVQAIIAASKEKSSEGSCHWPGCAAVAQVYAGTLSGSPCRKLLADMWYRIRKDYFAKHADELPKEFIIDLSQLWLEAVPAGAKAWKTDTSKYMEHIE